MNNMVRVKIRPENNLKFPAVCCYCGQPSVERLKISKRKGNVTRLIDVPLCIACYQETTRRSWAEERWLRFGKVVTIVATLGILVISYFIVPTELPVWLRWFTVILLSTLVALGSWGIFKQRSTDKARPEKQAISKAVQMVSFSWRTTTFLFSRADYSEQFATLNQGQLTDLEL